MKRFVSFFEIPATDFDRAIQFYEAVFSIKMPTFDCDHEKMAFFPEEEDGSCPGAISWSSEISFLPSQNGVLISLEVDNMETALSLIEKNAGKILIPKTKIQADNRGFFSVFTDCEGNRLGLYSDR